jgi:hypothetical protein
LFSNRKSSYVLGALDFDVPLRLLNVNDIQKTGMVFYD